MKLMQRILGRYYNIAWIRITFELVFIILPAAFIIRTFIFGLYQVPTGSMETTLLVGERFFADKLTYWFRKPVRGEIIAFNAPDLSVCSQGYPYSTNKFKNLFERYVWGPSNWTKRVIGIPGDRIVGKIENNRTVVYRNGEKLDEGAYINKYPLIAVHTRIPNVLDLEFRTGRDIVFKSFDPAQPWDNQPFYRIDPAKIAKPQGEPIILEPGTPLKQDEYDITLKDNQYWVMGDNRLGSGDSRMWGVLDGQQIHGRIVFRIWSMDSDESWWIVDLIRHPIDFWKKVRWSRCLEFIK